jgi:S1-C subfamily serine protease
MSLTITLGKFPVPGQIYATVRPPTWRGLRVDFASVLLRNSSTGTRLAEVPDGVLVTEVQENSPAARTGITPNTVLTHVGGTRVHWPAEFHEAIKKLRGTVDVIVEGEKLSVPE